MYMIVVLRLKNDKRKTVWVPAHWCSGFSMKNIYNSGLSKTKDITVFYSKNKKTVPNFNLMISDVFVEEDACYTARFKTCLDSVYEARMKQKKTRSDLPVNYNENNTDESNQEVASSRLAIKKVFRRTTNENKMQIRRRSDLHRLRQRTVFRKSITRNQITQIQATHADNVPLSVVRTKKNEPNSAKSDGSSERRVSDKIVSTAVRRSEKEIQMTESTYTTTENDPLELVCEENRLEPSTSKLPVGCQKSGNTEDIAGNLPQFEDEIANSGGSSERRAPDKIVSTAIRSSEQGIQMTESTDTNARKDPSICISEENKREPNNPNSGLLPVSCQNSGHTEDIAENLPQFEDEIAFENIDEVEVILIVADDGKTSDENLSELPDFNDPKLNSDAMDNSLIPVLNRPPNDMEDEVGRLSCENECGQSELNTKEDGRKSLAASPMTGLEIELIQNIMADGCEVEMFGYDPDKFPIPFIDPNQDKKPDLSRICDSLYDTLFGNLIFETDPEGNIIYNGVRIRSHIVELLRTQNQLQNSIFTDKKFVFMLMLELFGVDDMVEHHLEPHRRSIIQDLFEVRVGSQEERLLSLNTFLIEGCEYFRRLYARD